MCQQISIYAFSILRGKSIFRWLWFHHMNYSQKSFPALFYSSALTARVLRHLFPFYYTCTMISLSPTDLCRSELVISQHTAELQFYATLQF